MRRLILAPVLALTLVLFAGCDHVRLALNMRTSLAKVDVTAMEPSLPNGPAIAPGESIPLVLTFTDATGKLWPTEGAGKGRIQWRDITATTTLVTFKKGAISLAYDPRISEGKTGHITLTVPSHPTLKPVDLDIPLTYAYPFHATFAGPSGSDGLNGTDGTPGTPGSPGSLDPNNPSPGGNGGNGTDGSNGQDGSSGGDGPSVHVFVTLLAGSSKPLLQVGVTSSSMKKEWYYLIDPNGGSLAISSNGGRGGSGGHGGRGGSGGSGGIGIPSGSPGLPGHDGNNGQDGFSGSPGPVTITCDPSAAPYLSVIKVATASKSTVQQAPVAPLW